MLKLDSFIFLPISHFERQVKKQLKSHFSVCKLLQFALTGTNMMRRNRKVSLELPLEHLYCVLCSKDLLTIIIHKYYIKRHSTRKTKPPKA